MSDEMAVGDNASQDDNKVISEETETEAMNTASVSEPVVEASVKEEPIPKSNEDQPEEPEKPVMKVEIAESDEPLEEKLELSKKRILELNQPEEPEKPEIKVEIAESDEPLEEKLELSKNRILELNQPEEPEKPEIQVEIAESDEPLEEKLELEEEIPKQDEIIVEQANPATEAVRGVKRRASAAFSDGDAEDFKGFDGTEKSDLADYSRIIERLEAEVSAAVNTHTPIRTVMASPAARSSKRARQDTGGYRAEKWSEHLEAEVSAAVRSFADEEPGVRPAKRQRQPTDGSRPSSALSSRSDGEGALSTDASSSPATRGRRATIEISSPLLRIPLERGWRRELVYRASAPAAGHDATARRHADIYYYTPAGKKLRSTREVGEQLSGTGLTLENFSFFKEPLGIDDPEKEIIRDAKVMRRVESPVPAAAPPVIVDGKRTPKPKPPKGASPEPVTPKSPPARIKVKSMGSRLSSNGTSTPKPIKKPQAPAPAPADNNNTAAWKKPNEAKAVRGRALANGAASPPAPAAAAGTPPVPSPRRRGRPRVDDTDYFTAFCNQSTQNVAVQIFQYLGMRDLARCARVCKLWQHLAATPALWRHVRMKNSHVSDWMGLCAALKCHGTRWLDLRKMLLPQNDAVFWEQFVEHIGSVDTLERLELCRCPARAVEAVCARLPTLRALAAPAIRDARLDPAPLALLPRLESLRLKSLTGLSLTRDLRPISALDRLQHLSLTSIKELGWCACEVVGQLEQLESLELGECSFGASFAEALGKLSKLRRLRLERGMSHCAAPQLLRALAALPKLTRLELVNFDVKVGFDDALAECKNIQRLLIIPTYVSQSATTNKQVLSGVLRLKETLTHLMWGVTIELLRVTELFIDQCEAGEGEGKRRDVGECIPVLKPVPGCRLPDDHRTVAGPPQVEILPIPTLQRLLSAQLPNTKLKLLRIPFHATWRQSLADFQ